MRLSLSAILKSTFFLGFVLIVALLFTGSSNTPFTQPEVASASAPACPPGQYTNDIICLICPAGSYCPGGWASEAFVCPGYQDSQSGSDNVEDCYVGLEPSGDFDGDGVANGEDNCPFDYNPGQEDGWGGEMGDSCDPTHYDNKAGIQTFQNKDGSFNVFGNCYDTPDGETVCRLIGHVLIDPLLDLEMYPDVRRFQSDESEGWFVDVFFVSETSEGVRYYLVVVRNGDYVEQDAGMYIMTYSDGGVGWQYVSSEDR